MNFAKFVRTPFLQNTTRRLLLIIAVSTINYFRKKSSIIIVVSTVNYFRSSKYLFQLNLVCIGDNHIGFCPGLLWKQELNLRSSHCSFPIKKCVLRYFVNFTEKQLYWSLFLIDLQAKRLKHMFSCGVYQIFKNLQTTASETCCFTWSLLFNKLHFGSNWYMVFVS